MIHIYLSFVEIDEINKQAIGKEKKGKFSLKKLERKNLYLNLHFYKEIRLGWLGYVKYIFALED